MLPIPGNSPATQPRRGAPPELDMNQALRVSTSPRPGQFPWLCGGFVASFASMLHFGSGQPPEHFLSVVALAFSLGMCGGWIIRQAGESAHRTAVTKEAWALYHRRRADEFRWAR